MNAREIKLVVGALLFTGAAFGGYWFYLRGDVQAPAEAEKKKVVASIPPATKINLGRMDDEIGGGDPVNIFNYRKEKLVAAAAPPEQPLMQAVIPVAPVVQPPPRATQPTNATPRPTEPAVVNVPLVYSGFARDDNNEMIAFLETNGTGAPAGHYNLREDDFLLGRFRVAKITSDQVEVEDMDRPETSRKQTITLKK